AFLLFDPIELGLEQRQGDLVVLVLAAFAAALGGNSGGQVRVADAALRLVLMLAARTAAAKRVAFEVFGADFDLDRAFQLRDDIHGGEGSLRAIVGVERADADEPVDTALALKVAVSVVADDAEGGAADAGFVVAQLVYQLGFETVALGPAGVHAEQ